MKILVLVLIGMLICTPLMAEKPTRLYKPVIKQLTTEKASSGDPIWAPTDYDCIVCNGYVISAMNDQEIRLSASDTLVRVNVLASSPTVSPAGFLFKGTADEKIGVYATQGNISITLSGWEED